MLCSALLLPPFSGSALPFTFQLHVVREDLCLVGEEKTGHSQSLMRLFTWEGECGMCGIVEGLVQITTR